MSFIRVLRTIFTADPSGFIKGADAVEKKLSRTAAQIERQKSSIGAAFSGPQLGKAVAGVLSVGAAWKTAEIGVTAAANAEQFELAVGVMLGSGDRAKQLASDLEKFAAATPFELPEIQAATRKLLAADVAAGDMTKTLTQLGNLAAGSGSKIDELASVYAKALGKGRLESEVINQFADRGIPLLKMLATQLGKTTGEVLKMAETGKLGLGDMNKALEGLTGSGGKFDQMMLKQSRTLAGLWSTLKDSASMTLKGVAEELLRAFDAKGAIERLTAQLDEMKPKLIAFAKDFGETFLNVWDMAAKKAGDVKSEIDAMIAALQRAFKGAKEVREIEEASATETKLLRGAATEKLGAGAMILPRLLGAAASALPEMGAHLLGVKGSVGMPMTAGNVDALIENIETVMGRRDEQIVNALAEPLLKNRIEPKSKQQIEAMRQRELAKPEERKFKETFKLEDFKFAAGGFGDAIARALAHSMETAFGLSTGNKTLDQLFIGLGQLASQIPSAQAKPIEKVELPPAALEGSVEAYKIAIRQQQQSTQSPDKKIEQNTKETASSTQQLLELVRSGVALGFANL